MAAATMAAAGAKASPKKNDEPVAASESEEEHAELEAHSSGEEDVDEEEEELDEEAGSDGDDEEQEEHDGDEESDGAEDADEYPVDGEEEDEEELEAVGFGDAMSKILQQNVGDEAQPILAKRTTARMREIMNEKKEIKKDRVSAAEKRAKERKDNVVPTHAASAKDRQLRKIATKGVVALFNAIAKHQHQTGKGPEKDDKKVKELSKEKFLGLLKGAQKDKAATATPAETKPKSSWSVLQDDFMMGAKLKDWDNTHANDSGKPRRRGGDKDKDDDSDPEAAEDKAWKQTAALDSDDESSAKKPAAGNKRKAGGTGSKQKGNGKKIRAKRS